MPRSRALVVVLAAAGALALAACTPGALDGDAPSETPTQAPAPSDAPEDPDPSAFEPAPSEAPVVGPVEGDLDLACSEVLTPQQVYDFNPEMLATASPAGGLPDAFSAIVERGGVVCAWQHATSGDVLLVGVQPADEDAPDDADAGGLTTASERSDDWAVLVGSRYFEGADDQARSMAAQVIANLG
ncbi:hypothetical protein [Agrococcus jejuensis]|uniref:hypothetical protein n=1 Tax=Agrococcus jejuensis TaxID=399736 RepID=UPI0011A7C279|nr:hypothetical protein [Agrococcus jejuensis]